MIEYKCQAHNRFEFFRQNQQLIIFNSEFDSGNCHKVEKVNNNQFIIWTANDCLGSEQGESHQKSWFYFSVSGVDQGSIIKFVVKRINMLYLASKYPDIYKPVYKINDENWKRLENQVKIIKENDIELIFDFQFRQNDLTVFFAFHYPYSYVENQLFCKQIYEKSQNFSDIYFHKEILIKSPQNRDIELITISSYEGKLSIREDKIDDLLFPSLDSNQRAFRFQQNKPIILISARVHPGETPSSFAMQGILNFLVNRDDYRSFLIRKYFVVLIIPMLNPDGVYNGHYRMDTLKQNLNRHYEKPDPKKQPSCYAVRKIVEYLSIDNRLFFYCDLHAHADVKGCFFYGNALEDYVMQVESQLFAKIMSLNCINFEYDDCNFSKKQMSTKDRMENLTKEGCSRVNVYKCSNIIHSYTLECGYHQSSTILELAPPSNSQKQFKYQQIIYQKELMIILINSKKMNMRQSIVKYIEMAPHYIQLRYFKILEKIYQQQFQIYLKKILIQEFLTQVIKILIQQEKRQQFKYLNLTVLKKKKENQ